MAMKPKSNGNANGGKKFDNEDRNFPTPKAGARKARISLIVDLGTQKRPDFENKQTGETKPQASVPQVAIFADLVSDVVDYGGKIGKQQYRLMINKSFQGEVQGITFKSVAPRDNDGNLLEGKPWGFHPANMLTKLCKAVDMEYIAVENREDPRSLDIELLLNAPFLANVEVKETPDKNGKKDAKGELIVYKNVNFKGPSPVPMIEDEDSGEEKPMPVAKLTQTARCISFDNATKEDIQYIRGNLIAMIKLAEDYAGSNMQKAIEAYEAENGSTGESKPAEKQKQEEKPVEKAQPKETKKSTKAVPVEEQEDDDIPF